jgi:hypothetical protein
MAKASGINQTAISRIWRAFSLAPHRAETFKLSKDADDQEPPSAVCLWRPSR